MGDEKVFCNHCREEGTTIGDIMRKPQSSSESANASIFVTRNEQMEGVEDVEPPKCQCLSRIVYGYIVPKSVIQAPVTVRKRSCTGHNFKRQLIFLKQFLVLRIVVRRGTVEDRIEFFGLLVRNTRILDYGECRPVAQSRI